jgi:HicB family
MKPKIAGYALRLPASLKEEAEGLAAKQGSSLNQFIISALAEKVARLGGADKDNKAAGEPDARSEKDEVASEDA